MATGDLEGNLERLRVQLRTIGYPHPLDTNKLKEGSPAAIMPLLHYALLGYSRHVSRYLSEKGYALFAKSDLRFVECTLKYLREEFAYRCPLTVAQIFSRGFAERKFLFVHDVIQVCKRKHSELAKQSRQAQQARKTVKRTTTFEIVKGIDPANLDSLHMVDVAEKLEKLLLTLKGDVQRITSDMQVKLNSLERQTQYLEQSVPLKHLMEQKMSQTQDTLQLAEREFPLERPDDKAPVIDDQHHIAGDNVYNMKIPQSQTSSSIQGIYYQQEQLSTGELIAKVEARCNMTKELLEGKEYEGQRR